MQRLAVDVIKRSITRIGYTQRLPFLLIQTKAISSCGLQTCPVGFLCIHRARLGDGIMTLMN